MGDDYIPGESPDDEEERLAALKAFELTRPVTLPFLSRAEVMSIAGMSDTDWRYFDRYELFPPTYSHKHRKFTIEDTKLVRHLMILRRQGVDYKFLQTELARTNSDSFQLTLPISK